MSQKKTVLNKIIGTLHLWLGLASGIVVVLLGLSGALYVFVDEIKPLVYQDRLFIQPESKPKLPLPGIASRPRRAPFTSACERGTVRLPRKSPPAGAALMVSCHQTNWATRSGDPSPRSYTSHENGRRHRPV